MTPRYRFVLLLATLAALVPALRAAPVRNKRAFINGTCDVYKLDKLVGCRDLGPGSLVVLQTVLKTARQYFGTFSLSISNSNAAGLPDDVLVGYDIEDLRLSGINLTKVDYAAILHGTRGSLRRLSIWEADIRVLKLSNIKLDNLDKLEVSNSGVEEIDGQLFQNAGLNSLVLLYLSGNRLKSINSETFGFSSLWKTKILSLANNQIQDIQWDAFSPFGYLIRLELHNNRLQTLPKRIFEWFKEVSHISLGGNPFYCNCDLQWLKEWLNTKGMLKSSGASCAYPFHAPFKEVEFCSDTPWILEKPTVG